MITKFSLAQYIYNYLQSLLEQQSPGAEVQKVTGLQFRVRIPGSHGPRYIKIKISEEH